MLVVMFQDAGPPPPCSNPPLTKTSAARDGAANGPYATNAKTTLPAANRPMPLIVIASKAPFSAIAKPILTNAESFDCEIESMPNQAAHIEIEKFHHTPRARAISAFPDQPPSLQNA